MKETITYDEVLQLRKQRNICFVDVRSENEYKSSTIPSSYNIPILNNQTREDVGTLYVGGEVDKAKRIGVEYASNKLPEMLLEYEQLTKQYDEIVIFCSRGGMRSESIYSLLKSLRFPVLRLHGGYKAYRQYLMEHLDESLSKVNYVTLYGLSGSGKTEILQQLNKKGAHILDLEGCANHRGSLLGGIGLSEARSQKMFESLLYEESLKWNQDDIVYTEGESRRVGPVVIPSDLFEKIKTDCPILINSPLEYRIKQIHNDYIVGADLNELAQNISILTKVINPNRVELMQEQLRNNQSDEVISELLTTYYDVRYQHNKKDHVASFINTDPELCAEDILEYFKENNVVKTK